MNESTLLYQKMKAGDRSAFDELFRIHYNPLVRFAYSKIDDIAVSEDIVQNIFIEFWTKRETINIESAPAAYLQRTVHNRCIDYFRKQNSIKRKEAGYFQSQAAIHIASPEEELLKEESLKAIYAQIEALPYKCKVVFKLSRYEQMTYAEIAQHLDISKKTVEMHISTALKKLREGIF